MSIWIYRKDKDYKKSIYSISVPFEAILIIFGIIVASIAPRYIQNSSQLVPDAIAIIMTGFVLFLISKISMFIRGIWNSWGTMNMRRPFTYLYRTGYFLMVTGLLGCLLLNIS